MTANPSVSVVMPSFNHARFIRQAIDSVLAQGYEPLHLLVMDGGSRDETVDILRSYGDRIRFVSEKDGGQSDALNRGFARVGGDILVWLNSDDVFLPGAIHTVVDAFRRHPEAQFVYGRGWNIDEHGRLMEDSGVLPFNLWKIINHRNFIHQPSCFFRRALLDKVGPIREDLNYVMDWELWVRFAAYPGVYVDEMLSCNRTYAQNKTQSGVFRRWREIRRMVRPYAGRPWPPVAWFYLTEAVLQWLRPRRLPGWATRPLDRLFWWGMTSELSGVYADGGAAPAFAFTVPNPERREHARLTWSPISRYDPSAVGGPPVRVAWRSSAGRRGTFELQETGRAQDVVLPLDPSSAELFTHFSCRAASAGRRVSGSDDLPARRVVGFLDRVAAAA
jgi:glycosyltransferase involved in cell wall biosynthesis